MSDTADAPRVIDLTTGRTARVRVERDGDPFAALTPAARKRLYIRVLCELVAYGELDHGLGVSVDLTSDPTTTAEQTLAS